MVGKCVSGLFPFLRGRNCTIKQMNSFSLKFLVLPNADESRVVRRRIDTYEIVVDSVKESVAANLGCTTREVVNVVVLEGNQILGSQEEDVPVVVAVAVGRP